MTAKASSALISRERSSIRWSISGALVASISFSSSSWLMQACLRACWLGQIAAGRLRLRRGRRRTRQRPRWRRPVRCRMRPRRAGAAGPCGEALSGDGGCAAAGGSPLSDPTARSRSDAACFRLPCARPRSDRNWCSCAPSLVRSSTCFLRSAISASRIASWNWPWNSEAMRRSLRHPLAERAQRARQFLRTDHDQRNNADEEELAPTDVEHRAINSKGRRPAGRRRSPCRRPRCA